MTDDEYDKEGKAFVLALIAAIMMTRGDVGAMAAVDYAENLVALAKKKLDKAQ